PLRAGVAGDQQRRDVLVEFRAQRVDHREAALAAQPVVAHDRVRRARAGAQLLDRLVRGERGHHRALPLLQQRARGVDDHLLLVPAWPAATSRPAGLPRAGCARGACTAMGRGGAWGTSTEKVEPRPGAERSPTSTCISFASRSTIARPRPMPLERSRPWLPIW